MLRTKRSAWAFRFGLRGGNLTDHSLLIEPGKPVPVHQQRRAAADPTGPPGLCEAGVHPLAEPDALLLCDRGQDRQNGVLEDPAGIQVLLRETAIADAVLRKPLEVVQRLEHSLPAEPVQGPKQHQACRAPCAAFRTTAVSSLMIPVG